MQVDLKAVEGELMERLEVGEAALLIRTRSGIYPCKVKFEKFKDFLIAKDLAEVSNKEDLESELKELFKRIGIPPHLRGYNYIIMAIELVVEDMNMVNKITKELYPKIADAFNTTSGSVERGIRKAIDTAWTRGDIKFQERCFGYTIDNNKGKPTNSEFIASIADLIRLRRRQERP